MSSSEEIDSEIIRTDYTDRHKRRLAHKRSLNEFKKICKKIRKNATYDIANDKDDSQMDSSCNSHTDTENIIVVQYTGNINVQASAKDCASKNEEIYFNEPSTSEKAENDSGNEENININEIQSGNENVNIIN